ncbi:MAG: hypothetical protein CMJ90_19780 [Planctomycetes bacterium]|nr:hypothetical protein [Planctomycetota bacterium]
MKSASPIACLLLVLASCGDDEPEVTPTPGPIVFDDVTAASGVEFAHFNAIRNSVLPEDMGSGAAWGDVDGDGLEDLYLVNYAGPLLASFEELQGRPGNALFRNQGDGTFENITEAAGLSRSARDAAALLADLDNDGDPDLVVTGLDGCALFRNDGGTFTDVTKGSGVDGIKGMALGPALGDYDLDGDLDLYVPCYVTFPTEKARDRRMVGGRPEPWTTPASYPAQPNALLRNEGGLKFSDQTAPAGVVNGQGRSMQAVFVDLDGDRYPDLFVGNDQSADILFHNQGDGTFTDVSMQSRLWDPRASMGVAVGDIDGDGDVDLHLTHFVQEPPALMRNDSRRPGSDRPGRLLFQDVADESGLLRAWYRSLVGWATALQDLDNDGDIDIIAFHGSTIEDELTQEVFTDPKLLPQRPMLLTNDGTGKFTDVRAGAGPFFEEQIVARGGAFADFDQDGRVDAVVNVHNGRARLLRNVSPGDASWMRVRLVGQQSNRDGVGAVVEVDLGDRVLHRQVICGSSYLAGDSLTLSFGLGDATPKRLLVTWPVSGKTQVVSQPPTGKTITVTEPR